jgi:hypothetical protein
MFFFSNFFLITVLSVTDIFPQVSLNFAGGASLDLRPQDYLIQQNSIVSISSFNLFLFFIFPRTGLDFFFSKYIILSLRELHFTIIEEPLPNVPLCRTFYTITYFIERIIH